MSNKILTAYLICSIIWLYIS